MNISKNIFAIRNDKRLTQSEVALRMGIDQPNYARLEKRDIELSIKQLSDIAVALGVTIDDILHYGEEKPQVVDNEKVKELENKVLLLEKDLEICKSKYALSRNELKNGFVEILSLQNFIQEVSEFLFKHHLKEMIKENIKNPIKVIEELNQFTTTIFLLQLNRVLEEVKNDFKNSMNYGEIVIVYNMLSKHERNEVLLKELKNLYAAVSINFEWSEEQYNQTIEECKLQGYNFTNMHSTGNIIMEFGAGDEGRIASDIYDKKIKPLKLLNWIQVKNLKEYKHIPEVPAQTGFFRLV